MSEYQYQVEREVEVQRQLGISAPTDLDELPDWSSLNRAASRVATAAIDAEMERDISLHLPGLVDPTRGMLHAISSFRMNRCGAWSLLFERRWAAGTMREGAKPQLGYYEEGLLLLPAGELRDFSKFVGHPTIIAPEGRRLYTSDLQLPTSRPVASAALVRFVIRNELNTSE